MPNVELKQTLIQEIASQVDGAQSVVVVDYRGLNVAEDTELRKGMREAGIVYKVYKNTMMRRAFEGTDCEKLDSVLEGPSAIAISKEDATAPARLLAKYGKTMEAIEIKAGIVEGEFYDADAMKTIAAIPSREELLAKLFGSLQSPITNFARVMNQLAEKGGAEAAEQEKEEAAAEEAPAEEPEAAAEEPAAEEAPAEEAAPEAEEPAAEEAPAEEPEAAAEEPAAEEAPAEEVAPEAEEPAAEEAPAEEPEAAAEEPAAEEAPEADEEASVEEETPEAEEPEDK